MSKTRLVTIVSIIGIAAIIATSLAPTSAKAEGGHDHQGKIDMKAKPSSHSGHLSMVSQSIDNAIKALESGNKGTALAELHKAQKMLAAIKKGVGGHEKPKFANARCPVMGSAINPEKVGKNLVRDYKGQKVAFCCGGCPRAWDRLTDAQKDAKLAKAKPKHSGDKH